jgi:PadR family transcriptional regulator, regulatory protein PadR
MNGMAVRELLLGLWKIHIHYHAGQGPVVGQWILRELREHGYEVSPGTLYPLLARMEASGWLRAEREGQGIRARKLFRLTRDGETLLDTLRPFVRELCEEMS